MIAKRILDVVLAGSALICLAPLVLPVMLALRLTGEGEIFYRQQRIGRGGVPFGILKFATMLKESPHMAGGDISRRGDPRILPLGHFLRWTKINELPQLVNIIAGEMSIIGPRPLTPRIADLFPPDHWAAIAHLRPGLSGVGSIVFRREEDLLAHSADRLAFYRDAIVPHKSALERWYAARVSVPLDVKLIALTVAVVVRPEIDIHRFLPGLPSLPPILMLPMRAGS